MVNWNFIIWPVLWAGNHWIVYVASFAHGISLLLDPAATTLNPEQNAAKLLLDSTIIHLTAPSRILFLNNIGYFHPTQRNNYDCGAFIIQLAVDFLSNPLAPVFMQPDCTEIRNTISSAVREILKNRKLLAVKDQPAVMHYTLADFLCVLEGEISPTKAMDALIRANTLLNPDKYRIRNRVVHGNPAMNNDASLQALFDRKPSKARDKILHPVIATSCPSVDDINTHFRPTPNTLIDFAQYDNFVFNYSPDIFTNHPFTTEDIVDNIADSKADSAPGFDKISFPDLRALDPKGIFLMKLFNSILQTNTVPEQWKFFETLLIIKEGKETQAHIPGNWRPIALLSAPYRIFCKIINRRLLQWSRAGNMIHSLQRAICRKNACAENNLILNALQTNSTRNHTQLHMCFLDLADAFGSIPHELIWFTLAKMGLNYQTIDLFRVMYYNVRTQYKCNGLLSDQIQVSKGVKQGCPLSMTLFCLCINIFLEKLNNGPGNIVLAGKQVCSLAYADDIVVIADSHQKLVEKIKLIVKVATDFKLTFKPSKCGYYHNTILEYQIFIYNAALPLITKTNTYKYLGTAFGEPKKQDTKILLTEVASDVRKFASSGLKPAQVIKAEKMFCHPKLLFALNSRISGLTELSASSNLNANPPIQPGFDNTVRNIIRSLISEVDKSINNNFLYASTKLGGLGIMPAKDEYYVQKVVGAFTALNSGDPHIIAVFKEQIIQIAEDFYPPTNNLPDALSFLSGTREVISFISDKWWTLPRIACEFFRNKYDLDINFIQQEGSVKLVLNYNEGFPRRYFFDVTNIGELTKTLHDICHVHYAFKWRQMPSQGMLATMVGKSPLSNMNVISGNMPIADWTFVLKGRTNTLPLNYRPHNVLRQDGNGQPLPLGCRHCLWEAETQCHVFNHCPHSVPLRNARHNLILDKLTEILRKLGFEFTRETPYPGIGSTLLPDLIINLALRKKIVILDVKSPYDVENCFEGAKTANETKYRGLALQIRNVTHWHTSVRTFCVGALGSWDPENDRILGDLGISKADIRKIASKTINVAISISRQIFIEHVKRPD